MIYRFGDCELDDQRYELRRGGVPRHLEPQVFEVLAYLVRNRDRVVAKTELLDQIWGSRFVTESALTSRLKAARRAVGDSGRAQQVIGTVHGCGYRFLAPVQERGREARDGPAVPLPIGREAELERLVSTSSAAATTFRRSCLPRCSGSATPSWWSRPTSCSPAPRSTRGRPLGPSGTPSEACSVRPGLPQPVPGPLRGTSRRLLHYWAALALWFLGRPDSALRHAEQARALAEEHPYSLASAEVQLAYLHQYRGEPQATLRWAEQAAKTTTGHGFPIRAAQAAILGGWARAVMGAEDDGVGELRSGLAMYLATGAELDHPYYLGLLGEALAAGGHAEEGLALVEEAIQLVGTARPFYYQPELHRLRGDLLARDPRQASQAAEAYHRAMELAAGQGARSPELRASIRLCRLPASSRPAAALAGLRELYDQFEEGGATPDLVAARALVEMAQ
jgi:DNA-binding winged helix-turn-helix (wHTH) protein/tetratricopeptide (TPR) repeat protein